MSPAYGASAPSAVGLNIDGAGVWTPPTVMSLFVSQMPSRRGLFTITMILSPSSKSSIRVVSMVAAPALFVDPAEPPAVPPAPLVPGFPPPPPLPPLASPLPPTAPSPASPSPSAPVPACAAPPLALVAEEPALAAESVPPAVFMADPPALDSAPLPFSRSALYTLQALAKTNTPHDASRAIENENT